MDNVIGIVYIKHYQVEDFIGTLLDNDYIVELKLNGDEYTQIIIKKEEK